MFFDLCFKCFVVVRILIIKYLFVKIKCLNYCLNIKMLLLLSYMVLNSMEWCVFVRILNIINI